MVFVQDGMTCVLSTFAILIYALCPILHRMHLNSHQEWQVYICIIFAVLREMADYNTRAPVWL